MKNIIITGAAGMVGSELLETLIKDKNKMFYCFDNLSNGKKKFLTPYVKEKNFKFFKANLETRIPIKIIKKIKGNIDELWLLAANSDIQKGNSNYLVDYETLKKLNKGYQLQYVKNCLEWLTKYGLHPHLTIMVGYHWQTQEMLDKTVKEVRSIMLKGLARTLQVTLCTPLDYTPYHEECIKEGKLLTDDYNDFDMSKLIVKTPIPHDNYYAAVRKMYSVAFHPLFILRQILFLFKFRKRDWQFLFTYGIRAIRRVKQHVFNLTVSENKK